MTKFYLLEAPSERAYAYAFKDTSLLGLQTDLCDFCGRKRSRWETSGPHCFLLEGGPRFPDRLPYCGAGGSWFLLGEQAAAAFAEAGITGIVETTPVQTLPATDPGYVLARIGGRIELDLAKMCLKKKKLCPVCGGFEWNRQRLYPLFLDENTWDGSDICRVRSIPGYIICTNRVVALIKRRGLKGFCFKPL